jgi:uncharacterized membrane protein YsdA (DUF1294 family)
VANADMAATQSAMIFPLLFFIVLGGAAFAGALPCAVLAIYLGASVLTFVVYAHDKSAARNRQRRIRERTLHLCSLGCGWPGAWFAQKALRHKSLKQPFQRMYLASVAFNCGALLLYAFPRVPMQAWSLIGA